MDEHSPCPPPRLSVAALTTKTSAELIRNGIEPDPALPPHAIEQRRRQFLHGRLLARQLLSPGSWRIERDGDGRPVVRAADGARGPDLSISHSGGWVAAALAAHGRVGIDVETPRRMSDAGSIAEAYLSPAERRAVMVEGEPALLAFWTMREAIAKLAGGGIAVALALDGAALPGGRDATCRGDGTTGPWVMAHRDCGTFQIAVAWSAPALPDDAAALLAARLNEALREI